MFALACMLHAGCAVPNVACVGADGDGDGIPDMCDNCPFAPNPDQTDSDHDGVGDRCDIDDDGDGILDDVDPCPFVAHGADPPDSDGDGLPDVCDRCPASEDQRDTDGDGVVDCFDLCPDTFDPSNADSDGDGVGDACDNCPFLANAGQQDLCGTVAPAPTSARLAQLRSALSAGEWSCEEVVQAHLDRVMKYNLGDGSTVPYNAFTMLNEHAMQHARDLDEQLAQHGTLRPMHCVVVAIKSNFSSEELDVSNGTLGLVGTRARGDAAIVGALREAGAIVIGATTMDEFARGTFGIGSAHGRTGNAFDPTHSPGGSSSGSAVAVAAGFAHIALGTDNCASLLMPAAYHGLVSLRATVGQIDDDGIFPSSVLDLVPGAITRSVPELAATLDVIAPASTRYVDHLTAPLRGRRIGVLRRLSEDTSEHRRFPFDGGSAAVQKTWHELFDTLRTAGVELLDNIALPGLDPTRFGTNVVPATNALLRDADGPVASLVELCDTGRYLPDTWRSVAACKNTARAGGLPVDPLYVIGSGDYADNARQIETVLDALGLDALIYPVASRGAASTAGDSTCLTSSVSGLPAITVPVGSSPTGLPIGITLLGRRHDEATLIELAAGIERTLEARPVPALIGGATPMTVSDYNALLRDVGELAFDRHLRNGRFELTPERMQAVVADALETR